MTLKYYLCKQISHAHYNLVTPVLFVKKKDGSLWLCVDFRALNKVKSPKWTGTHFSDLLTTPALVRIYMKIDLKHAYHLVCIAEGDKLKTAFHTQCGSYKWTVPKSLMASMFRDICFSATPINWSTSWEAWQTWMAVHLTCIWSVQIWFFVASLAMMYCFRSHVSSNALARTLCNSSLVLFHSWSWVQNWMLLSVIHMSLPTNLQSFRSKWQWSSQLWDL